jgi:hypothetical protein
VGNRDLKVVRIIRILAFVTCTHATVVVGASNTEPPQPAAAGPYLAQEPPGSTPRVFAPGIVSSEQYREYVCVFSPGGMECVFDRYGDDLYKDGAVFTTRVENGTWIEPEAHPFFGAIDGVFQPTVSPDGTRWFFTSNPLGEERGIRGGLPLFYVDVTAEGWGDPVYFAQGIHASASLDGTVYYSSWFNDGRDHPAYRECVEGTYSERRLAGYETLTDGAHPVVSPDSKYIFFKAAGDIYWVDAEIITKLKPDDIK